MEKKLDQFYEFIDSLTEEDLEDLNIFKEEERRQEKEDRIQEIIDEILETSANL